MADKRIITIAADIAMHKLHNAPAKSLKGGVPMRVRFMTSGKRVSTMEGHGLVELFGLEIRVRRLPKGLAVRTVRQHHVLQQRHAARNRMCLAPVQARTAALARRPTPENYRSLLGRRSISAPVLSTVSRLAFPRRDFSRASPECRSLLNFWSRAEDAANFACCNGSPL